MSTHDLHIGSSGHSLTSTLILCGLQAHRTDIHVVIIATLVSVKINVTYVEVFLSSQ